MLLPLIILLGTALFVIQWQFPSANAWLKIRRPIALSVEKPKEPPPQLKLCPTCRSRVVVNGTDLWCPRCKAWIDDMGRSRLRWRVGRFDQITEQCTKKNNLVIGSRRRMTMPFLCAANNNVDSQGTRDQWHRRRPGRERPPPGSCLECHGEHPECYGCPNRLGMKDGRFQSIMRPNWYCRYKCGQDASRVCGGKGHGIGHHKLSLRPDARAQQDIFDVWKTHYLRRATRRRSFNGHLRSTEKRSMTFTEPTGRKGSRESYNS